MSTMKWLMMMVWMALAGCSSSFDAGGGMDFKLPFASGQYWRMTQGYGDEGTVGSHKDWGGKYMDDSMALDFAQAGCNSYGKSVFPVAVGTVLDVTTVSDNHHGYGNSVLVDHGGDIVSRYGHLSQLAVEVGDIVDPWTVIGAVGNTGYVKGSACPDHPGTHLHLAVYEGGEAISPFPLAGVEDMELYCWYNREGEESCTNESPDDYEPIDDRDGWDNEESMVGEREEGDIKMLEVSPARGGVAEETWFVWSTVIESEDEPEATLWITNPVDHVDYSFRMETESHESPWVFIYSKTLQSDGEYEFWVESDNDRSEVKEVDVDDRGEPPFFREMKEQPEHADRGELSYFEGCFSVYSDDMSMSIVFVNANDAAQYEFPMEWGDTSNNSEGRFTLCSTFEKALRDSIVYPYWIKATSNGDATTSPVYFLDVD